MLKIRNVKKDFNVLNRSEGLSGIIKDMLKPSYKTVRALQDINIEISRGDQICFVGRNGAGKSTLIKLISSIIRPTSGEILIDGKSIFKNSNFYKKKIGVFFGNRSQLSFELALRESLVLQGSIYGMGKIDIIKRISYLQNLLELKEIIAKPVREMSLGQRIRSEIALTLMHSPEILLLDEPTIGLDLEYKDMFYQIIKNSIKSQNLTLILTSHDINDIRELADRLIILDSGKIMYNGKKDDFFRDYRISQKVVIEFNNSVCKSEVVEELEKKEIEQVNKYTISVNIQSNREFVQILEKISKFGVHEAKIIEDDMYSVLLRYYKGEMSK